MINLHFDFPLSAPGDERWAYRLAKKDVASNVGLRELALFEGSLRQRREEPSPSSEQLDRLSGRLVYQGPGWIGHAWRQVKCTAGPDGYLLAVDQVGEFGISAGGRLVSQLGYLDGATRDSIVETMLGPGLILALAMVGTWCWHASAILAGDQAVVFLGESGSGKSTLAAYLDRHGSGAWRRLADDVLPIKAAEGRLQALPHFPQLKLAPTDQPGPAQPEAVPLGAIYILAGSDADSPEISGLSAQEAGLALVRHTVAARLFDQQLLADHLAFCAHVAASVPVKRLAYRRSLERLPHVGAALGQDLNP